MKLAQKMLKYYSQAVVIQKKRKANKYVSESIYYKKISSFWIFFQKLDYSPEDKVCPSFEAEPFNHKARNNLLKKINRHLLDQPTKAVLMNKIKIIEKTKKGINRSKNSVKINGNDNTVIVDSTVKGEINNRK